MSFWVFDNESDAYRFAIKYSVSRNDPAGVDELYRKADATRTVFRLRKMHAQLGNCTKVEPCVVNPKFTPEVPCTASVEEPDQTPPVQL